MRLVALNVFLRNLAIESEGREAWIGKSFADISHALTKGRAAKRMRAAVLEIVVFAGTLDAFAGSLRVRDRNGEGAKRYGRGEIYCRRTRTHIHPHIR